MLNVTHEELRQISDIIKHAIQVHISWRENLIRILICKLTLPDSIFEKDAHRNCDFGRWFYDKSNVHLHDVSAFNNIEELHRLMHDSARDACLKSRALGRIPEEDYDQMMNSISRFQTELNNFHKKVQSTLENVES